MLLEAQTNILVHDFYRHLYSLLFTQNHKAKKRNNNNNSATSNTYFTASTEDRSTVIKEALEHREHLLVNKIANTILNNELASDSKATYTTDQLVQAIKQKYFPPASEAQINAVLSNLAGQFTRVASETRYGMSGHQITLWQSRKRFNWQNVLKIAKLCNPMDTGEDIHRLISIHQKYRKSGREYN